MNRLSVLIGLLFLCVCAKAQDTLRISLRDAIEIALSENPTIKIAGQEIELKKTANKESLAGLLPEVSLVGSYSRVIEKQSFAMGGQVIQVGMLNTTSGGVNVSLPVFAPTLWRSINLTKQDVELAVEKSRESRLDMINQVTRAYYSIILSQDSYEVLQRSYQQSIDNYNVIAAKFDQGTVSEYDKISAEVQMRSLKPNVVAAENAVSLAMLQLKVLMGVDGDTSIKIDDNLRNYEYAVFANEAQDATNDLSNSTSLRQLALNHKMLEETIKLKKTSFMPTLAASFQYMYTNLSEDLNISHYRWIPYSTAGLTLSIPLFKGSNFTQLKQAKIQLKELEQTQLNTKRQLDMQAQSFRNNMQSSTEQVLSNKENVNQAVKGRDIASKRYEVGRGTILELNNSEVALTQAELTYVQSVYDYLVAKADLDKVLGIEGDYLVK
ncbi:MAG: TolC family protein [Bacteroidales bacterium]|nr:TolC family protein [Bacteroidales bacterium]